MAVGHLHRRPPGSDIGSSRRAEQVLGSRNLVIGHVLVSVCAALCDSFWRR